MNVWLWLLFWALSAVVLVAGYAAFRETYRHTGE